MRYVVRVKDVSGAWIDFEDRFGEKREYDNPAYGHDWIAGATALPGSPEYRLFDREDLVEKISSTMEAIVYVLKDGPLMDSEICDRMRKLAESGTDSADVSDSQVRTARNKMVKTGFVRQAGWGKSPRGKRSATWELA